MNLSKEEIDNYINLEAKRRLAKINMYSVNCKGYFIDIEIITKLVIEKSITSRFNMDKSYYEYNDNNFIFDRSVILNPQISDIEKVLVDNNIIEKSNNIFEYNILKSKEEAIEIINSLPSRFDDDKRNYFVDNLLTEYEEIILERQNQIIEHEESERILREKNEIKEKFLEKERKQKLRLEVRNELQEEGLVFNSNLTKRNPIPDDVKDKVWNRDGGKCVNCGSNINLEFDHIIPHSKGGANTYRNLQLLCESCNRTKSNKIG
ncbi:HNH endonuclease [Empedobacter brevis]|uniref:HNH endonuclease n=1 Tax=Empedobacter brevis TaxID=247 RepID=UPI0028D704B4|nr:HNH endonuclease [Empedobacter brevis]